MKKPSKNALILLAPVLLAGALIIVGIALWSVPAALVVSGILLLWVVAGVLNMAAALAPSQEYKKAAAERDVARADIELLKAHLREARGRLRRSGEDYLDGLTDLN